mgnify:CR=1 FL=1
METLRLADAVSFSEYPGRGIIVGRSCDGEYAIGAYFIMGRSANSRNRRFVSEGGKIRTVPYDESKVEDPSLIIYTAVRSYREDTIITNGDQTDTVYVGLASGVSFEQVLRTRRFEPDGPNFTPRISAVIERRDGDFSYAMSILKTDEKNPLSENRYLYTYDHPRNGIGRFIHTYAANADPLPSFEGEPKIVELKGGMDEIADTIWNNLNEDNRISLAVRFIDIASGEYTEKIINKYGYSAK